MLGRKLNRGRAEDRVYACSENADGRARGTGITLKLKVDQSAFAAPDPVALNNPHFFRPALQLVEISQQFLSVLRRAHKPLLQLTLLDLRVFVTPAASIHHLLVGQHGGTLRTPVDLALFAIDQSFLVELEKEPLVPPVIIGQASGDLA